MNNGSFSLQKLEGLVTNSSGYDLTIKHNLYKLK